MPLNLNYELMMYVNNATADMCFEGIQIVLILL